MAVEEELARFARCQHGLVSRRQARSCGLSPSGIQTRLDRGDWVLARRGVYALAGVPPTQEQAALAVHLAVGGASWISHRSAAGIWGLEVPAPPRIEVLTLPSTRVALEGVDHHRSRLLALADVTIKRGVPVTSVARTLVDCVAHLGGQRLVRAVDDAERRGLLRPEELASCLDRLDRGGRRRLVPLRAVVADRTAGRLPGGSHREVEIVDVLRRAAVPLPVQQYEVVVGGRRRVIDHAYPDERVGIEWDGFAEHGRIRSTFDDDRLRGNDLAVAGWLMLHFTSNTPPEHIVARTTLALSQRRRRPA